MQFQTTIAAIEQKTPSVKSFVLDCGTENFPFHPGQWVDIHQTINDETHNCGYSITSIPEKNNTIEIAVKLAPDLLLTEHLHQESKVGDHLYISKAQGDVWINKNINGPYVFIAGGVGITPLISMINHITRNKPETRVALLYSITSPEEYLFRNEIEKLESSNPNFECHVTVTRSKDHDENFSGRISESILKSINPPSSAQYYLCGPPPMVDAVVEILKRDSKIDSENIHYDKWWA